MGTKKIADPESFVIGGPTFYSVFFVFVFVLFFLNKEIEDPNTTINGPSSARQRNISLLCG